MTKMVGTAGPDSLTGGFEADSIEGGDGNDTLDGVFGADTLIGGAGNDSIDDGFGNNLIDGGEGNDTLNGGFDADTITGGVGDDYIDDHYGSNSIIGGDGNDIISTALSSVNVIDAGAGNDRVDNRNTFSDSESSSLVYLGSGNDTIYGGGRADTIHGQAGNDFIDGSGGADIAVFSGTRADYAIRQEDDNHIIEHKNGGADGTDTLRSIEIIRFSDASTDVTGQKVADASRDMVLNGVTVSPAPYAGGFGIAWALPGTSGNDIIKGSSNNDLLNSVEGNDAIDGAAGNDIIDGGVGSNFLTGGTGTDKFMIDGRGAAGTSVWSTVTDFNKAAGENVTIFGWVEGVSSILITQGDGGADGFKGATWHLDINGDKTIDASITLTGGMLTSFTTSFGMVDGVGYMLIG